MIRRILVCLVLVAGATAGTALAADAAAYPQQEPGASWVVMGPQHGAYLGVYTRDVTAASVSALKLKEDTGVEITMVDQDAPAGKAGLREHDVILSYNGDRVEGEEELRRMVRETPPGRTVTLGISRDGAPLTVHVTLGDRAELAKLMIKKGMRFEEPAMAMPPMAPMAPMPPMALDVPGFNVVVNSSDRSGLLVENLTPQLAEYFGVKGGAGGILVRSVQRGSPAETAGFKAGDVVISLAKEKVADINDWIRIARRHSGEVPVSVVRAKRVHVLKLKLPDHTRGEMITPEELRMEMEKLGPQFQMIAQQMQAQRANLEHARLEALNAVRANEEQIHRAMELDQQKLSQQVDKQTAEKIKAEMKAHKAELDQARQEALNQVRANQAEIQRAMKLNSEKMRREMEKQMKELNKALKEIRYDEN